jgi:hypothetical protein
MINAEGSIFDQFGRVNVRDVFQFVTGYRFPSSDWQPGCVKLTFFPPDAKSMPRPTARICSGVEEFKLPIVEDYQTFKQLCIEALVNTKKYQ